MTYGNSTGIVAMMIAHNVYFRLNDNRPAVVQAMIADCHKYRSALPGIVFYAAGTPSDADRSLSDSDYDVSLHVVFQDRAAMETYMTVPKHVEFMAKYEPQWKDVLVFDSCVSRGA
jgi:hypothetical protein